MTLISIQFLSIFLYRSTCLYDMVKRDSTSSSTSMTSISIEKFSTGIKYLYEIISWRSTKRTNIFSFMKRKDSTRLMKLFCEFCSYQSQYPMFEMFIDRDKEMRREIESWESLFISLTRSIFSQLIDLYQSINMHLRSISISKQSRYTLIWGRQSTPSIEQRSYKKSYIVFI